MNWTRTRGGSKAVPFAAIAVAAGLTLTGCAAGQRAQTSSEIAAIGGASGQTGSLLIRNAGVGAPDVEPSWHPGSTAPLVLTFVNEDLQPVELTSVTTSAASSVVLGNSGASSSSGSSVATASSDNLAPSTASDSDSATPTDSAVPSDSTSSSDSASPSAAPSVPITIPGHTSVKVGFDESSASIELTDLKSTLYPGNTIPVTFLFSNGSSIALSIPVNLTAGDSNAPTLGVEDSPENND